MMTETELLTVIKSQMADTIRQANDGFMASNRQLLNAYNQELYGNEEEGRSQVVSSDVYDAVESDMPALARIFLGSNEVMEFQPLNTEDVKEAEQKTKYANYLIRGQRDSFKVVHDWIKEPGFAKCSVVKFYCETTKKPEYVTYKGLSDDEYDAVIADLSAPDNVDRVEEVSSEDTDYGKNVKFTVIKKTKKITVANVPPESFVITRGATSTDTAAIVGDVCRRKKGELIAEGYDRDIVKGLMPCSDDKISEEVRERFKDVGGYDYESGYHWTNEEVVVENLFVLVDYDDDGIQERRAIVKVGDKILENEPYGLVPYALLSQILMPHSAIGKSRGEQASRYQLEKTAIKRGMFDNAYAVNRPRLAIDDSGGPEGEGVVNIDDAMNHVIDGIIRVDGPPMNSILPIVTPYSGDKALQVIQHIDSEKSNSLGMMLANQGLDADKLYKETATRFEGVQDAGQAKIELVARVYAETGFRDLYEGVIWLAQHYQDEATEIMVLGEQLTVDPTQWKHDHYCQSQVGIGAGDSAEMIQNLSSIVMVQQQLIATGSPLADHKKLYNALSDLVRLIGKPDPGRYYNNPEVPEETLMAQNMQLTQIVQQMQQQQNPLAEAELIRAKAKMAEVDGKESNAMQQFLLKMEQENKQFTANIAKQLTELELKYSTDVPGSVV